MLTKLPALGRVFFAVAIAAFGGQQIVIGAFVTRALPEWPAWVPGLNWWPQIFGAFFVLCAIAIISAKPGLARRAALAVAFIIFTAALLLHVPRALADPSMWGMLWTFAAKGFVLGGAALIVASSFPYAGSAAMDHRFESAGRWLLGAFLAFCGYEHFHFASYVQVLVPKWIPGPMFWTYFSGAALIAAGVGLVIPLTARLAAVVTGTMIFAWVVVLHLPRAMADVHNANETTAMFEALALAGVAWLLAALLPRRIGRPLAA